MNRTRTLSVAEAISKAQTNIEDESAVTLFGTLYVSSNGASMADLIDSSLAIHIPSSRLYNSIRCSKQSLPNGVRRIGTVNMFVGTGTITCQLSPHSLAPFRLTAFEVSRFSIGTADSDQVSFDNLLEATTEFVVLQKHHESPIIKLPGSTTPMIPIPVEHFWNAYELASRNSSFPNYTTPRTSADRLHSKLRQIERHLGGFLDEYRPECRE